MDIGKDTVVKRRQITYIAAFLILFIGYFLLRKSAWQGSIHLHTLMELTATLLALDVGILALIRFYSKKDNTFLFVGTAFFGTGFLDGYHTVVTSSFFINNFPGVPSSLIPWSWLASRSFLSILLWLSWIFYRREARLGEAGRVREQWIYALVAVLMLASFIFFAFVPLPSAYFSKLLFPRPQEFVPAFFFLLALIGYLQKGRWKSDSFDHWLVLSIIVGFMDQTMFMSTSPKLYDMMFDAAHLLKKLSYICTLIGLLINMYLLFIREEEDINTIKKINEELKTAYHELTKMQKASINIMEDLDSERKALSAALKERETLLKEIHHRVKNNMQVMISLLRLQARTVKDERSIELLKDAQSRISIMSLIHEKLYRSKNLAIIGFKDYIEDLVESLTSTYGSGSRITIRPDVEALGIDIDKAVSLGLIINELVTNSIKHAFPEGRTGEVRIMLRRSRDNEAELIVSDNGVGLPDGVDIKSAKGLGMQLVAALAENQLQGRVEVNRVKGTEFRIRFKI